VKSVDQLRESVALLREYVYNAASYPGPEPGKVMSLSTQYPNTAASQLARDQQREKEARQKLKKKNADSRADLRKLSVWLQRKHDLSRP
jgi:hypothetical protein